MGKRITVALDAMGGFGVVLFIPGILQIIAGFKFVKAIKMYED